MQERSGCAFSTIGGRISRSLPTALFLLLAASRLSCGDAAVPTPGRGASTLRAF